MANSKIVMSQMQEYIASAASQVSLSSRYLNTLKYIESFASIPSIRGYLTHCRGVFCTLERDHKGIFSIQKTNHEKWVSISNKKYLDQFWDCFVD